MCYIMELHAFFRRMFSFKIHATLLDYLITRLLRPLLFFIFKINE